LQAIAEACVSQLKNVLLNVELDKQRLLYSVPSNANHSGGSALCTNNNESTQPQGKSTGEQRSSDMVDVQESIVSTESKTIENQHQLDANE